MGIYGYGWACKGDGKNAMPLDLWGKLIEKAEAVKGRDEY
jgi:hypothetical protein